MFAINYAGACLHEICEPQSNMVTASRHPSQLKTGSGRRASIDLDQGTIFNDA